MEYKFRGKRIDNGEWVYGWYFTQYNSHFVGRYEDASFKEVDPETVGQYTGRKDKNGVEVYGGDTLNYENLWPKVVEDYRVYPLDKVQRVSAIGIPIDEFDFDLWTVTGTIHDDESEVIGNDFT